MKHILVRLFSAFILLSALLSNAPSFAAQASSPAKTAATLPADLYQAFIQASADTAAAQISTHTWQAGGLSFQFDSAGPQTNNPGLGWSISFNGFGRGHELSHLNTSKMVQSGNRQEYQRGALTEWYRPTVLGLEQGFTIQKAPGGSGNLILQLNVQTDLPGSTLADASGVIFSSAAGDQALHYDNLRAFDAKGKELPASMSYANGAVIIQVNDQRAAYPITVDPLVYLQYKVLSLDGASSDIFGGSVSLSGDTALVGAPQATVGSNNAQGSAYVFIRTGTGWVFKQKLTVSDGLAGDQFGSSVTLDGDTALVGAPHAFVNGSYSGAAYVFTRSGTTWSQQAELASSDGAGGDNFGASVALSGDTALVGASSEGEFCKAQGAAYIFTRSGISWSEQQELFASDKFTNDRFGSSVALSGDTALIGSPNAKVGSNSQQGAVYIFTNSGSAWSQRTKLTASDGAAGDLFGSSLDISGDTVLIGAEWALVGSNAKQGAAYIFTGAGSNWNIQQKLTAYDGAASDNFGTSVALSGDTALVGAFQDNLIGKEAAYLFNRIGSVWSFQQKLTASDEAAGDEFGDSVALSGDTAMVGARNAAVGGTSGQGAAYTFEAYRTDTDLDAAAAINTAQANPGDTVYLSALVTNMSSVEADYVVDQVSLPSGLTYVKSLPTQGSFDPATGSWSLGTLPAYIGATLTIQATVDLIPSQTLTFSHAILGLDNNNANNHASTDLQVLSPAFSASPTSWDFGLINNTWLNSPAKTFTITNTGQANMAIGNSLQPPAHFSISSDTCSGALLAPANSCSFNVNFMPSSQLGIQSGSIVVPDNAPGNPHQIALSGNGASELTSNGSFNLYPTTTGKIPTGWTAIKFSSADGKDLTAANVEEGAAAVKINGASGVTKTLSQIIPANSGSNFLLSLWVKGLSIPITNSSFIRASALTTNPGVAQAQVLFYSGTDLVQTKTLTLPGGTFAYTQQTVAFPAPGSAFDSIKVVLIYSKPKGTIWFDNLSLLSAP
ncbi:MAG: choice-of-anchor D domain-containing protein [Anaerolineaceae bacterium]|nr:choice-of-anchor D domain-containing protein [Anaerolineaceae bacterium]